MPSVELISSAAIRAITLSVMESRRPERRAGRAPGRTTVRTIAQRPRPKLRMASISLGSVLRTPPEVDTYMGKLVATPISATLAVSVMPNQTMNSGTRARKGTVRRTWTAESRSSSPRRKKPVTTPSTSPVPAPISRPRPARVSETPRASVSWPLPHSSPTASATWAGEASTSWVSAPVAEARAQPPRRASGPRARRVSARARGREVRRRVRGSTSPAARAAAVSGSVLPTPDAWVAVVTWRHRRASRGRSDRA
ncbi:hypothetical protein VR45_24570 [Streptomyces sp. NRRL S-495]|nr:hypothetical protein VR45_24570 [Streptomyces sp. NRRL S-495]